jgi:uncharacterized YigZ family protein
MASVFPVSSESEARELIKKVSKETFDATHHCFAYKIKADEGEIVKCSDAGEPHGTAGSPILSAIESEELTDILVVVTRYFGGTKLGTGGLSRAYRQTAQAALKDCQKVKKFVTFEFSCQFHIRYTGRVTQILARFDCRILDKSFEDKMTMRVEVRKGSLDKLKGELLESTNGQIEFV